MLSQANKILFEQCKDDKVKIGKNTNELQTALQGRFQDGIEQQR